MAMSDLEKCVLFCEGLNISAFQTRAKFFLDDFLDELELEALDDIGTPERARYLRENIRELGDLLGRDVSVSLLEIAEWENDSDE